MDFVEARVAPSDSVEVLGGTPQVCQDTALSLNSWVISQGLGYEPCACFGVLERLLLGKISTIEALYMDIGMLVLVSIILLCYPGNFLTIRPWFLKESRIVGSEGGT